jgi:very-short-patch-repair endonuclease
VIAIEGTGPFAIETDGEETHGTRGAFQSDRRRDQRLLAAGYRVGRVTWRPAENEPVAVASRIKRTLESA